MPALVIVNVNTCFMLERRKTYQRVEGYSKCGSHTHVCEAEEEADAPENLQCFSCMIQHHIATGETMTLLFTWLQLKTEQGLQKHMARSTQSSISLAAKEFYWLPTSCVMKSLKKSRRKTHSGAVLKVFIKLQLAGSGVEQSAAVQLILQVLLGLGIQHSPGRYQERLLEIMQGWTKWS